MLFESSPNISPNQTKPTSFLVPLVRSCIYARVTQGSVASENPPKSHIGSQGQMEPPGGSDVLGTHIAPSSGSLPPYLPSRLATPPLSRVTRLRRVQHWLAPSPILPLPHSPFVFKYSPTLCTQPTQGSSISSTRIFNVGLSLDLDLKKRKEEKPLAQGGFIPCFSHGHEDSVSL